MSSTTLASLREPLRAVLGDTDAGSCGFSNEHLDASVRLVVMGGKIRGHKLAPTLASVEPALDDPNAWLLTVYEAALVLARPRTEGYRYRTRALSESFEGQKLLFLDLLNEVDALQRLREGTYFASWQQCYQSMIGRYGIEYVTRHPAAIGACSIHGGPHDYVDLKGPDGNVYRFRVVIDQGVQTLEVLPT